jgi:hypothetical protein
VLDGETDDSHTGYYITGWWAGGWVQQQRAANNNNNNNSEQSDLAAATFFSAFSLTLACVFMIVAAFVGGSVGYDPI